MTRHPDQQIEVDFSKLDPMQRFMLLMAMLQSLLDLQEDPEIWKQIEERAELLKA